MNKYRPEAMHEKLNALADNELNARDTETLMAQLDRDEELRGELCDIRRVKDLLQYAYPEEPVEKTAARKSTYLARAAAVLVLVLSGFAGAGCCRLIWDRLIRIPSDRCECRCNESGLVPG